MTPSPELVIYRGLPASGKTTLARAWVAADPTNRARVNRDDLRQMLHGGYVDGPTEHRAVSAARDALIERLLRAGVSVACDDTNLPQRVARQVAEVGWRCGAHVRVSDLTDVPVELCVERDWARGREGGRAVGDEVIRGMHDRFLAGGRTLAPLERSGEIPLNGLGSGGDGYRYVPDRALPPAWLVDLDGTLALMGDRGPFDWHRVGEDLLNEPVADIIEGLLPFDPDGFGPMQSGSSIVILSGRDEVCRAATIKWLKKHRIGYQDLLMRPEGDQRKDAVVKLELFREQIAPRWDVLGVLDDRNQVVEMWRSIGLFCAQVAPGDF